MDLLTKPILIGAAAAAAIGWSVAGVQSWRLHSEQAEHAQDVAHWAEIERQRSTAYATRLERDGREYAAQAALSTRLGADLAARDEELRKTKGERDDAIRKVTDGRECLRRDALRLLNAGADRGPGLPASAPAAGRLGDDAAAPAGTPADHPGASLDRPAEEDAGPGATDEDVALWITDARGRYASCARRLKGWQEWYRSLPTGESDPD